LRTNSLTEFAAHDRMLSTELGMTYMVLP